MKKGIKSIVSALLCVTVAVGGSAAVAYAAVGGDKKNEDKKDETKQIIVAEEQTGVVKDETVYVLTKASGEVKNVIVSDHLKNYDGKAELSDRSTLQNIENVKGDETYSAGGDTLAWNANGGDIYYRGNSSEEPPVKIKVTYTLDGKDVTAEEIAGKSGRVTIRFDYESTKTAELDGKNVKVPFAAVTGLILDGDVFKNVTVMGAKAIDDGDRTVVVGAAFPGLRESLGISETNEKITIPEYFEVEADAENFELENTFTVATNSIFTSVNADGISLDGDIDESLAKLSDAMNRLEEGSGALYSGLSTLYDKSGVLSDGVNKLSDGAKTLSDGAKDLSSGSAELDAGLAELSKNSAALNAGAEQVFDALLKTANDQIAAAGISAEKLTKDNYATVIAGVVKSLNTSDIEKLAEDTALETVTAAVNAQRDTIKNAVEAKVREGVETKVAAAVREQVLAKTLAANGLTKELYESGKLPAETKAKIDAGVDAYMQTEEAKALVKAGTDTQMQSATVKAMIESETSNQVENIIEQKMKSDEVMSQIENAVESASAGVKSLESLKNQLDSYKTFYAGLKTYTAGVDSAKKGADELSAGAKKLSDGAKTLSDGIGTVKENVPALVDGVGKLRDGAKELSDGIGQFDTEGVGKIIDALDGNLGGIVSGLKDAVNAAKAYNNYSGIADEMSGSVKFIYRTDAVSAK